MKQRSPAEKVEIARQLSRLGVDIIEAGFPAASETDFSFCRKIIDEGQHLELIKKDGLYRDLYGSRS